MKYHLLCRVRLAAADGGQGRKGHKTEEEEEEEEEEEGEVDGSMLIK